MIKVIDLYSDNTFEPEKIIKDGFSGIIFKAGQGAWADVPRYKPEWWQLAQDYGLKRGWYWLCDSRKKSADHIYEMINFDIFDDVGELGLWVDVEKPMIAMTEAAYWKTPYAGYKNLIDFVYLITHEGITPGIYSGPGAYELVMRGAPKSAHDYLAQFKLWTAQYPWVYVPVVSKPSLYGSWKTWEWWQYREGPDINIYNGTIQEFETEYGETTSPPEEPEEPPIIIETGESQMTKGIATYGAVNLKPMVTGTGSIIVLSVGGYVYGLKGISDIMGFTHYYTPNGAKMELGVLYKASLANMVTNDEVENPVTPPPVEPPVVGADRKVEIDTVGGVTTIKVDGVIIP